MKGSALIAVVGAEGSGKTTLAQALAGRLQARLVPEELRAFVDQHQRPPSRAEQSDVLAAQLAAEAGAGVGGGWVVSDAGALMTAVYSRLYYRDDSLWEPALAHHRTAYVLTLWCGIDIPWLSDPGYRDGPDWRRRGHLMIAEAVERGELAAVLVEGSVERRLEAALTALGDY